MEPVQVRRHLDRRWAFVLAMLTASSAALGVASASVAPAPEVPVAATPKATCGPGSRPETGLQGRVSQADHESGRAAQGYTCNTELLGSITEATAQGTYGGFKVLRYVDSAGHECAFYDTTLLFPTDVVDGAAGVRAVDMSDPSHPVVTDNLVTPAMLTPHESLVLSEKTGRLVAVSGNPVTNAGVVDAYDVKDDCLHPTLLSSLPVGLLGHESGMAPDGNTFYSASPGTKTIQAVGLEDLPLMTPVWTSVGVYPSHGLSVSDDGNRIYVAGLDGLHILDVSEVQARVQFPEVTEVAHLAWDTMSIPQNALPVTIDGSPYLIEIDEFGSGSKVGAGRIIDITDESKPTIVSNLRLEVHQPEHFAEIKGDPSATNPLQGYAGHYCAVPRREDPGIVACSMILSGLRVFDIRDPRHPKEIAYFNAPIPERDVIDPSNFAMSAPAFVPERGEIWYSDGFSGFYAVKVTNGVWPFTAATAETPATAAAPSAPAEASPSPASLPATGAAVPTVFVVTTGLGALLLLWVLRSTRHDHDLEG
ncbi:MAG: LVIVD repeat-containing protein [Ornithinibacter sp.]